MKLSSMAALVVLAACGGSQSTGVNTTPTPNAHPHGTLAGRSASTTALVANEGGWADIIR